MSQSKLFVVLLNSGMGICPELTRVMADCLKDVTSRYQVALDLVELPIGPAGIDQLGHPLHPDVIAQAKEAPLILKTPCSVPEATRYAEEFGLLRGSVDWTLRSPLGLDTPTQAAWVKALQSNRNELDLHERASFPVLSDDRFSLHEWQSPDGTAVMTQAQTSKADATIFARRCIRLAQVRARSDKRDVNIVVPVQGDRRPTHDLMLLHCLQAEGPQPGIGIKEQRWGSMHAKLNRQLSSFDMVVTDPSRAETIWTLGASKVGPIGQQAGLYIGDRNLVAHPLHGPAVHIADRSHINPIGSVWALTLGMKMLAVLPDLEIEADTAKRIGWSANLLLMALSVLHSRGTVPVNEGGDATFSQIVEALRFHINDQFIDYDSADEGDLADPPGF